MKMKSDQCLLEAGSWWKRGTIKKHKENFQSGGILYPYGSDVYTTPYIYQNS